MKRLILILVLPLVLFGGLLDGVSRHFGLNSSCLDTVVTDSLFNQNISFSDGINLSCANFNTSPVWLKDSLFNLDYLDTTCISFWIYPNFYRTSTTDYHIARFEKTNDDYQFLYWNDSPQGFRFYGSRGASPTTFIPDTLYHTWNHCLLKFVHGDSLYFYFNGEKKIATQSLYGVNNRSVLYGANVGGGGVLSSFYYGKIDEITYFDRNLSDAEIQTLADTTFYPFADVDTFLIDWNGIDLDLIDTWNGIDLDLIQSINGINLK